MTTSTQKVADDTFGCCDCEDDKSILKSSSVDLVAEMTKMKVNDSISFRASVENSSKTLFQNSKPFIIRPPIFCVEIPMRVVSVEKTGKIGVCSEDNYEFITEFNKKYETLNYSEILEHTLDDSEIFVGLIVAVPHKREWRRGVVERLIGDDCDKKFEVYMMDYGSYTTLSLRNIRKVSFDDRNQPCRSFEFSLFGVANMSNDEQHEGFSHLKEFLLGKSFLVEFVYSKPVNKTRCEYVGFMKMLDVESKDSKFCKDVGGLIIKNGWASYKSPLAVSSQLDSDNWTFNYPSVFEAQELALHRKVDVTIAHVHSLNDFYVRKTSDSEVFSHIESRLESSIRQCYEGFDLWNNDEYSKRDTDFIGMTYVHKKWHRVQLRRLYQDEKMAEVFLMDRGDICLKPFDQIYKVPKDVTQYPSLVFRCSLHLSLTPEGECLLKLLKKKFRRLHNKCAHGHKLILNCFKIVRNIHTVNLYTGYSEEYGSALVKLGYATYEDDNEKLLQPEEASQLVQDSRDLLWIRANK